MIWLCFVVALFVPTFSSSASAADDVTLSASTALTQWATSALGQQQGECFPWLRRVVKAATGIQIGDDYRLGYLQAGAVEVSAQAAKRGDIIQIANDADTHPFADYPGLHTALVLDNLGGGKFRVIDSNSNFDGVVRIRETYDPGAAAARYPGLSFHIYRLPERPPSSVTPPPPNSGVNTPGVIPVGAAAEIAAEGDCLRVRSIAGLSGTILGCLPTGMRVTVTQPGPDVDGYHWVTITNGVISGWASERYLRPIGSVVGASALPTPAATPAPPPPGRILSGVIPEFGIALVVFSGGSDEQLLAASGCPRASASFWSFRDQTFVQWLPGVPVPIVNAEWRDLYPNGIPAGTPLMVSCRRAPAVAPPPTAADPVAATTPSAGPPASAPTPAPSTYTVEEGDSLSAIAERLHGPAVSIGTFLDALYELNGITADSLLRVGQVLKIPR